MKNRKKIKDSKNHRRSKSGKAANRKGKMLVFSVHETTKDDGLCQGVNCYTRPLQTGSGRWVGEFVTTGEWNEIEGSQWFDFAYVMTEYEAKLFKTNLLTEPNTEQVRVFFKILYGLHKLINEHFTQMNKPFHGDVFKHMVMEIPKLLEQPMMAVLVQQFVKEMG